MRLAFLLVLVVSCVPPPVYRVQRTARVPRPAVPLRTGEPLAGPLELSVGASTAGNLGGEPRLADQGAAVEVPSQQYRAELRIRIKRGELAPFYENALESSLEPLDPTQAAVREGTPSTAGLATRYSIDTGAPGFSIGLGFEMMSSSVPYVEYRTCVEWCEENGATGTQINYGTESVGSFGFALTPTYRTGNLLVFGGMYSRRHPTIKRKGTELYAMDYDRDVDGGAYNLLVHAGVEYQLPVVSLTATLQQNLTADPVQYGPSLGFALAFRVPELAPDRPRPPREPTPIYAPPSGPVYAPGPVASHDYDAELPDDPW